jgi:hypothetical protein
MNSYIQKLKDDLSKVEKHHGELYKTLAEALEENTELKLELQQVEYEKGITDILAKAFKLGFKIASVDKHDQAYVIASDMDELRKWGK